MPVAEVTVARASSRTRRRTAPPRTARSPTAAAKIEPPKDITLKDPKDWTIAGKPLKRLDTPDKVNGKNIYSMDVTMPGMLNATIKECPVHGGKLKSFDAAKVASMPGVKKVVRVGDNAVAVIADTFWQAKKAIDALPIVWDEGDNAKVSSAIDRRHAQGRPRCAGERSSATKQGDVKAGDRRRGQEGRGGLRLSRTRTTRRWSR